MRKITQDDRHNQVQLDENGIEFHFEKVYVPSGDKSTEYSLMLRRVEHLMRGESSRTYVPVEDPESKHFIIVIWPGMR